MDYSMTSSIQLSVQGHIPIASNPTRLPLSKAMVFERHATKLGKPRPCMGRARSPIARGSKSAFSPYAAGDSADIQKS
jgi:hypothetical protein